ncbi:FAD-dependent monooxygenase [Labedaea rhizosphaerae]|uniref:2-polyprenyl-6-methoxyphenol hydroxylase-like FAD-dependent oxidoreductase n=1 Tax=Labedaea rhizosphaerae TaxID=598644 RepID=A0A4R6SFE7_LABRH|nr:FAD-dependent monooxygenase [Labedaea rhizosphaerae]TDP97816.1 2-polyprenyl-6-methoxyphenol hydroxylase-like FAD-dependent oxidoreductase [Labedaea rhizosphaerae]
MTSVLVSGAGIAGPALAHELGNRGFDVTVVERAPALREGGSAVDFRGKQTTLLAKMGILDDVRALQTAMGEQVVIDERGERVAALPSAFFSGDVEIERGDLTRILYDKSKDKAEYVFGDWITALHDDGAGVDVTFASGSTRRFDLVVGADGTHSGVRALLFGPEERFRKDTGYVLAGFDAPNTFGLDHLGLIYNRPGLGVLVSSGRNREAVNVGLVMEMARPDLHHRDTAGQKRLVADAFTGAGWRVPELLEHMASVEDLYFDTLCQISLERWSQGRVVLLGDAAWSAGIGGSGTGLGMIGAYILAGELATAPDHHTAFANYEKMLRPAAAAGQKQAKNAGPFLAPTSAKKIAQRNKMYKKLTGGPMLRLFTWLSLRAANKPPLPDYPAAPAASVATKTA